MVKPLTAALVEVECKTNPWKWKQRAQTHAASAQNYDYDVMFLICLTMVPELPKKWPGAGEFQW